MIFRINLHFLTFERIARRRFLLSILFLCSFLPKIMLAQNSPKRDQQALTIIARTIAVGGGQELLTSIQDFTEIGTVTYYWGDQVTGNVTVKGRGLHDLKIEADLPDGKRKAVISGAGGSLTETNGRARPIFRQSANDLGSFTVPYLALIASVHDSSTSIIYVGLVAQNGTTSYDVRLQRVYAQQLDPTGTNGSREARDFYIDPKTFLINGISDRVYFGGPDDHGISHEILYSNYQLEDGIVVPLTIQQIVQNVPASVLTLNRITFNSGLADSDFAW